MNLLSQFRMLAQENRIPLRWLVAGLVCDTFESGIDRTTNRQFSLMGTAAQLGDISSRGAMVLTRDVPPDQHIWLCQAEPVGARWCPAKVVRVKETSVGLIEVGLALHAPRDSDLLKPKTM